MFMAEYLKFGGPALRAELFSLVQLIWSRAGTAEDGLETQQWPQAWTKGIIFPLWKRKGDRHDRNTWRGITLLSVGSKLVARICAARLQRWTRTWLNPFQFGFRKGSGVDDVQQITRSLLEEIAGSVHEKVILLRFFDLEKAYPKVARHALWKILEIKGCPPLMLKVLKALHNHTASSVRFEGAQSTAFVPERGLREGCPSSPILFNIYHHCIMGVFRARRARKALELQAEPGILWNYKVDGKVGKRRADRTEEGRNTKQRLIGDFAYADDSGIIGEATEVVLAEKLFAMTIADFAGKVNAGKTEGLRVSSQAAASYDVPFHGETTTVKHVGALLGVRGNQVAETQARINKTVQKFGWFSSAWTQGRGTHKQKNRIKYSVHIKVMKTVVKGVLSSFAKTRAWQVNQLARAQKVIQMAIRRCLGIRVGAIRRAGLNNRVITYMAQWESFDTMVRRATLMWIGHIARMHVDQPQKNLLFGWLDGAGAKAHAPPKQAQWINACLQAAGIPETDWFRLAQDRKNWKQRVYQAFPTEAVIPDHEQALDRWKVGRPLPPHIPMDAFRRVSNSPEAGGSDVDLGEVRRGRARNRTRKLYGETDRDKFAVNVRQQRAHKNEQGTWKCPVCDASFTKANQFAFHYEESHAVSDPSLVTVQSFPCDKCGQTFRRRTQQKNHMCPVTRP